MPHVADFAEFAAGIQKIVDVFERQQAMQILGKRIAWWADNLRDLAASARGLYLPDKDGKLPLGDSAKGKALVMFMLGPTREHCGTCASLNGQQHTFRWFQRKGLLPQQRGNKNFECGCWRCQCRLIRVSDGVQVYP